MSKPCKACGDPLVPTPGFEDPPYGHQPMTIFYECACGAEWEDYWCSAVDGECPECGADAVPPKDWEYDS